MIYNSKKEIDVQNAIDRINWLIKNKKLFELTQKREKRTIRQNRYEHLLFSWFALEYGETKEYVKQVIFKQWVNPEIFKTEYVNEKTGEIREAWRSTADLDTKEKTLAIDRFRDYSSKEAGIYLPEPRDLVSLQEMEIELSKQSSKQYV